MKKFLFLASIPYQVLLIVWWFFIVALNEMDFYVAFLPAILIPYLIYILRSHLIPNKGENITDWLNSQKKFRMVLVFSLIWSVLFLTLGFIWEFYLHTDLSDPYLYFFMLINFYPLVLLFISKFIVSAKE
tara:strand:- start:2882 stop:3271 length:390 start_codon:yes stop_codon:yes gene_type:complete